MLEVNRLYQGDCLEVMKQIDDKSVDMVLCDLPYNISGCKWDILIPFELLWEQYKRITKDKAAIVLTASQPFTSALVMSNTEMFKYELIFEKARAIGYLYAKKRPLACHENVVVFCQGDPTYNPQKGYGKPFKGHLLKEKAMEVLKNGNVRKETVTKDNETGERMPRSVVKFNNADYDDCGSIHPTQKPVSLFEYLIQTYSNEGELVLDNCAGSGTTGIACRNLNRRFILIEKDAKYCEAIEQRLSGVLIVSKKRNKCEPAQSDLFEEGEEGNEEG